MSRRPYYMALGAVVLATLLVLNLPEPQSRRIKLAWSSLFLPLFGLAGSARQAAGAVQDALLPRNLLVRQVETLRRENDVLKLQLQQWEPTRLENQRLRLALGWQPELPWRRRLARVVSYDPMSWWRSVLIDIGSREGVRTNLPVVTPQGLVGRISEVAFTHSRVLLVGDPNCRFSAQVETTRDKGIIAPDEASFDRQVVEFTYVSTGVTLEPGAAVATSGDGGVFPKGIPVGRILDVQTNEFGLYLGARVRLAANLNRLDEVWVLFP